MNVTSYRADGTVLTVTEAVHRQLAGGDYLPNAWEIRLASGKKITATDDYLDKEYPGWRDLPQASL